MINCVPIRRCIAAHTFTMEREGNVVCLCDSFDSFCFASFSDVILSAIGALLWAIGLGVWITIYQSNRVAWGEFADNISFVIPLGTA